jgi:hypothetical protein
MSAAWRSWRYVLVLALLLPLALSSGLPTLARLVGGPAAHVCHCELRGGHSTCACPICNPDRDDLRLSEASIRGKCGDDDEAFGASLGPAVAPPAGVTILSPDLTAEAVPSVPLPHPPVFLRPRTRPPRLAPI